MFDRIPAQPFAEKFAEVLPIICRMLAEHYPELAGTLAGDMPVSCRIHAGDMICG